MASLDGRSTESHSAASYTPSDDDSDRSVHTIDEVDDGEISSYEDCVDDGVNASSPPPLARADDRSTDADSRYGERRTRHDESRTLRRYIDADDEDKGSGFDVNLELDVDHSEAYYRVATTRRTESATVLGRDLSTTGQFDCEMSRSLERCVLISGPSHASRDDEIFEDRRDQTDACERGRRSRYDDQRVRQAVQQNKRD